MTECFCKTLWSFPGRMENTQVPCPPGRLLEKIMWMKGCSGQKLRRSSSKVDYTKTMLTLTHPRSLVKGDRTRAFLQGRCQFRQRGWMHCFRPAGISAGFLLRTRHQFPCLLSKVSRAESHKWGSIPTAWRCQPVEGAAAASKVTVDELRCAAQWRQRWPFRALVLVSGMRFFKYGQFTCKGGFSSCQEVKLKLGLESTASSGVAEASDFHSTCWLLSSLLSLWLW